MTEDFDWWRRRDGTRVRVRFMSHDHLMNAIRMLRRCVRRLDDELEMARPSYYAGIEAWSGVPWEVWAEPKEKAKGWIKAMTSELKRRTPHPTPEGK